MQVLKSIDVLLSILAEFNLGARPGKVSDLPLSHSMSLLVGYKLHSFVSHSQDFCSMPTAVGCCFSQHNLTIEDDRFACPDSDSFLFEYAVLSISSSSS